ncbi:MAG: cation-translocating P-type ATPase [Chloroflexota bacterium]
MEKEFHSYHVSDVVAQLETHLHQGLTAEQAQARLAEHGPNELQERPRPGLWQMLLEQLNNFLVIILIVACVISFLLGEFLDGAAIMAIVVLNAMLGVVQESKAERALAALKKMAAPNAQVIRDGHRTTIPARELVPGDIVLLEAGNYVPADMRLIESINLKVEEASLTGESVPVEKNAQVVLDSEIPLGDRKNSAFMSTMVTYGRGKGLVVATGMHTQIGLIAEMIQSYEEEPTPLQVKLDQLGRWLGTAALSVCGVIFLVGIVRDTAPATALTQGLMDYLAAHQHDIVELFMTAVSLAIAAVPEGLPAVVTICLALGMQRMVRRHALIRKLPAVETLGCATVVCSDKTGTLTQNQMTVARGWAGGRFFQVTGEGYTPRGEFRRSQEAFDPLREGSTALLLQGALLCNDAWLEESGITSSGEATWRIVGDPTEGALVVAATKAGLRKEETEQACPRVAEVPFDSERKRMTTIHQVNRGTGQQVAGIAEPSSACLPVYPSPYIAFVKGAPDVVLELCDGIVQDGGVEPLSQAQKEEVLAANQSMAKEALRVLGIAYRPLPEVPERCTAEVVERELVFVGLLGMIDPARPEVKPAVQLAQGAGMKSVMVTGDYQDTAIAIAREIGLLSPGGQVVTGAELDRISDEEFARIVEGIDAYARVSPQHKVRIVDAFKARGHVVAMTGDGVNDAPALKRASIGVAMGITGTDVTKETADMVLTDDNYASIIAAIEEGRIIYSNIRKFVFFLVSCNIAEILIIFLSMLAGLPIPLRPIQLLWLNLVTDGAPALALGLEKGDPDIMQRPPRPTKEPVVNREMLFRIVTQSLADTVAVMGAFLWFLSHYPDHVEVARTVAFATLVSVELFRAYSARSEYYSVFSIGPFSNRWMVLATASSFVLLLVTMYIPFLQPVFDTVPLTLDQWEYILPFVLFPFFVAEVTKPIVRRMQKREITVTQ